MEASETAGDTPGPILQEGISAFCFRDLKVFTSPVSATGGILRTFYGMGPEVLRL
jgi:hypothetical protein